MTVLHATEPATVYLSLLARVDGLTRADVDRALYDERTLVKQLAMRRTLFVFPRDLLPAAWGSASARVAAAPSRPGWPRRSSGPASPTTASAWLDDGARRGARAAGDGAPMGARPRRSASRVPGSRSGRRPRRLGVDATAGCSPTSAPPATSCAGPNTRHWRLSRPRWTADGGLAGGAAARS